MADDILLEATALLQEIEAPIKNVNWEVLYQNKCKEYEKLKEDSRDMYEKYQILKDENAYFKARNEKLEAIVRAVETLCGGKILDD